LNSFAMIGLVRSNYIMILSQSLGFPFPTPLFSSLGYRVFLLVRLGSPCEAAEVQRSTERGRALKALADASEGLSTSGIMTADRKGKGGPPVHASFVNQQRFA
jgi:hypothetical protein